MPFPDNPNTSKISLIIKQTLDEPIDATDNVAYVQIFT